MSMIQVENLTVSYPSSYEKVFDHVSFQVDTQWKLGLIGRNGRGKTTLLHLLMGKYEYCGKIISSVPFDLFRYPVADHSQVTIDLLTTFCPLAQEWEIRKELSYLDVREEALWRPFSTLSQGEQTKVLLAALFLNEDRFLLIDEPTNHLDQKSRETVSSYLNQKKGFILVSHDRCFLDGCVDHILSMNRSNIEVQSGNFSTWFMNFQQRQDFELAQQTKLQKEILRLTQAAKQRKHWSDELEKTKNGTRISGIKADKGHIGHKAAKMMKQAKTIQARQQRSIEEKSALLKNAEKAEGLKIMPKRYFKETLAVFCDVAPVFEGKEICQSVRFDVKQGDRIVLEGKNGCGKTSLLKLIMDHSIAHSGVLPLGSGLIVSYVPQNTSGLTGTLAAFETENWLDGSLFRAILRKMDFSRTQFEMKLEDYSAGQKKKVLIAKSLCEKAHLYVWDEPLNYIDFYSRMQIEALLQTFSPTMIFVEHDQAFCDLIATKRVQVTAR